MKRKFEIGENIFYVGENCCIFNGQLVIIAYRTNGENFQYQLGRSREEIGKEIGNDIWYDDENLFSNFKDVREYIRKYTSEEFKKIEENKRKKFEETFILESRFMEENK